MEDPRFRTEFRQALDAVAPPAPWLGATVRETLRRRKRDGWMDRARRAPAQTRFAVAGLTMAMLAALVVVALVLTQLHLSAPPSIPGGRPNPPPAPTASPTLTAAEQAELAQLEARPLKLPAMPANGQCPDGPHLTITPYKDGTTSAVWGNGTVFVEGGSRTLSSLFGYFDITFYTDPTVRGVVLIRGQQLDGRLSVVYVGDYAAGPVVGADTITGQAVEQHAEAALPAGRPPANTNAAPGWGIWKVRQGIDRSYTGCTGVQLDTAAGSKVIVAYDSGAPAR